MQFFPRLRLALATSTVVFAVPGCALEPAGAAASPASVELRVLVKLVAPAASADEVAQRASRSSGVPVRHVAAISPLWHGLALNCRSEAACADAMRRLKADRPYVDTVEPDGHRRSHDAARPKS